VAGGAIGAVAGGAIGAASAAPSRRACEFDPYYGREVCYRY
jgi:hypothetical protein